MTAAGKKGAIAGGLIVGLLAAILAVWHLTHRARTGDTAASENPAKRRHDGSSSWMPWFFTGPADPYNGPKIRVRVKVVDVSGEPVSGADVEARVDPQEWAVAGLTDEQYQEGIRKNGVDVEGTADEEVVARVTVENGATDREGFYEVSLKPDLSAVFF